jgi:hypothetical protein
MTTYIKLIVATKIVNLRLYVYPCLPFILRAIIFSYCFTNMSNKMFLTCLVLHWV